MKADLPTCLEALGDETGSLLPFADELLRVGLVSAFGLFEIAAREPGFALVVPVPSVEGSSSSKQKNESTGRLGRSRVSKPWRRF